MRKIFILAVIALTAASCEKEFKFSQPLSLSSERVELEAEEGSTPVIVYANGSWTAALTEGSEWARIENTSGNGLGQVKFFYDANEGLSRKAVIEISSANITKTVAMTQKAGFGDIDLSFPSSAVDIPRNAATGALPFTTNLPASEQGKIQVNALTEEGTDVDWLEELSAEGGAVKMKVKALSGAERVAVLTVSYTDALEKAYTSSVKLTQKDQAPYLSFSADITGAKYSSLAASVTLPFTSNLAPYIGAVAKAATSSASWATIGLSPDARAFVVDMKENESPAERTATLSFPFTDASGTTATFTYLLTQKGKVPRISFDELKGMVSGNSYYFTTEGALEGVIISDMDSPNMETAPNTDAATLDGSLNGRTGYIQSADGKSGFRILFSARADNIVHKGNQVLLDLNGTTIIKETDPLRYTIEGVTAGAISVNGNETPVVREKTLASLVDSDMYTLVKISGLEMSFKHGAYTNCHDGYSLAVSALNPAGMKTNESGSSSSPQKFDTTPCSMIDATGRDINLLINNAVTWRRYGNGVPQGTCSVTGILVHTNMPRWARGGDIGRYQLRPMLESDIVQEGERFSKVIFSWHKGWDGTQLKGAPAIEAGIHGEGTVTSNMEGLAAIQTAVNFNSLTNYNASPATDGYYKGQVSNAALAFAKTGGYFWASDNISDMNAAPWFCINFSTAGLSGSSLVLVWSAAQGSTRGATDDIQGPSQYKVEYSTDGVSFTPIDHIYAMHPIVTWSSAVVGGFSVPGLHQYVTPLPASLLGKDKVYVRVRAASNVSLDNDYLTPEGGTIKNYSSVYTMIRFGELTVQYN